ncbi:conserved hypothetical protein [Ricinus communis]|uniref:Uncharacterized protein n=1 Tax=Ricinus communis TaxID=3988 RepID=B9TCD5_RICCO|nr:conserved hypothetical protein [Ricinus communis]
MDARQLAAETRGHFRRAIGYRVADTRAHRHGGRHDTLLCLQMSSPANRPNEEAGQVTYASPHRRPPHRLQIRLRLLSVDLTFTALQTSLGHSAANR